MKHWIACGFVVVSVLASGAGCGHGSRSRHPMPDGVAWDGKWDTTFGPMILETKGTEVIGVYKYVNSGNPVLGVLKGNMSDNVLEFRWAEQEGGAGAGRGTFFMNVKGSAFDGTWGTGSNNHNGGGWKGQRM